MRPGLSTVYNGLFSFLSCIIAIATNMTPLKDAARTYNKRFWFHLEKKKITSSKTTRSV